MTYSPTAGTKATARLTSAKTATSRPAGRRRRATTAGLALLPLVCVILGFLSLRSSSAADIGAYGLIDALAGSPGYFVALAMLTVGFVVFVISDGVNRWLGMAYVGALIALLDGVALAIEGTVRFPTTYVHLGLLQAIMDSGHTFPLVDVRFSWPGFFSLFAYLTDASGLHDPMRLAIWFPFIIKLLWLAAIWLLAQWLLKSQPLSWLAVWLFELADWTSQSYFSPQALAFYLYLVVLLVLVIAFDPAREKAQTWRAMLVVSVAVFTAIVVSHQLTPVILIAVVGVLGVLGMTRARWVWLLFGVIFATWFSFATTAYWAGHMAEIFGNLGRLPSTFEENVGGRVLGSPSHVHVVYIRMALTLLIWLMATAGAFLAWRRRRLDARLVVLGVAPFLSLLLQSYDGEALIRAFLLGLPASVAAAAILLGPSQRGQHAVRGSAFASKVMPVVLTCVLLVLVPVSLVAKYGGESYESVTRGELRAAAWIQARLRPGDLVTTIAPEDAVRSDHAADVDFVTALDQFEAGRLRFVTGLMSKHSGQRFLVLTPSQQAYGTYVAGLEPGWYKDLLRNLARSPDFRPVHQDGRTYVFELRAGVHG